DRFRRFQLHPGGEQVGIDVAERVPMPEPPLFDSHPRMRAIRSIIESISDTDTTVLIRGESGVGKDLIARAVHFASARVKGPFRSEERRVGKEGGSGGGVLRSVKGG